MNTITPSSPLLTLVVVPIEEATTCDVLAKFHPIMKSIGYGKFELNEDGFYQASKAGEGVLGTELFVFAEANGDRVMINMDGHSIFGLKGVEGQLQRIKNEYESRMDCTANINGPNYLNAFIGNLLYTALPVYASAAIIILLMVFLGEFRQSTVLNVIVYATFGVIGAKTRFWVIQRKKQRPVWRGVLALLFAAPVIFAAVVLVIWIISLLV